MGRLLVPFLAFTSVVVPSVIGFLLRLPGIQDMEHIGNPIWTVDRWADQDGREIYAVFVILAVALALNVPRILRAVHATLGASADRRHREREVDPGGAPDADPVS